MAEVWSEPMLLATADRAPRRTVPSCPAASGRRVPFWLGPIIPGWWYPPWKLPYAFVPMKNPEKKITATMNTTPTTMPTHAKI